MKRIRWSAALPILLLGVGLLGTAIFRTTRNPDLGSTIWLYIGLPILMVGFSVLWVLARLRRGKSDRLWLSMTKDHPDKLKYLVMIHPDTRKDLERLGWKVHGNAYLSTPVAGVVLDDQGLTFWEGDFKDPALQLPTPRIGRVRLASVPDAVRDHPGIAIAIEGSTRPNELRLDVRTEGHRSIDSREREGIVEHLNSQTTRA